jgi:hypothetical protein
MPCDNALFSDPQFTQTRSTRSMIGSLFSNDVWNPVATSIILADFRSRSLWHILVVSFCVCMHSLFRILSFSPALFRSPDKGRTRGATQYHVRQLFETCQGGRMSLNSRRGDAIQLFISFLQGLLTQRSELKAAAHGLAVGFQIHAIKKVLWRRLLLLVVFLVIFLIILLHVLRFEAIAQSKR